MPKIVDRDARRLEIIDTYLSLAARDGVSVVTTRRLAEELGVATGSLWHYFHGFDEVLQLAFQRIFEQTNERIARSAEGRTGLDALCAMIEQIHPVDPVTSDEASVVVSFWGRIPFHSEMAALQSDVESRWHDDYQRHLDRAVRDAELREGTPTGEIADVLLTLVSGVQVEHVLRTRIGSAAAQWRIVATVLAPWLTPQGEAAACFEQRAAA